jgi:acetyltransferase-like isoleucine patch superfamily enzyme
MKCIINCRSTSCTWVDKYFPGIPAYMLKIADKPLLEYYIDLCSVLSIKEVRIVMYESYSEIEEYFQTGAKWGLDISYGLSGKNDHLKEIINKNRSFAKDSRLLIIDGFLFINYDKNKDHSAFSDADCNVIITDKNSTGKDNDHSFFLSEDISIRNLASIKDYYDISQDLLKLYPNNFVLPGYNDDDKLFIGRNVKIPENTNIEKPAVIGNNVLFKQHVTIGAGAIIGDNVLIDANTIIKDSIIYDGSYIGANLEIKGKIVNKCILIDPESDAKTTVPDHFLISPVNSGLMKKISSRVLNFIFAFVFLLFSLPVYILLSPFYLLSGEANIALKNCYASGRLTVRKLRFFNVDKSGIAGKIFCRLSLDKLPLLLSVFKGNLCIAGNTPLPVSLHSKKLIRAMKQYRPAVFTYSESLGSTAVNEKTVNEINELYYSCNSSLILNGLIVVQSIYRRLIWDNT